MSWERLGLPEYRRGMGFRDLEVFNQAVLVKTRVETTNTAKLLGGQDFAIEIFPTWEVFRGSSGTFSLLCLA